MTNILKKIYQRLKKPPGENQPKLKKLSERMRKLFRKKTPANQEQANVASTSTVDNQAASAAKQIATGSTQTSDVTIKSVRTGVQTPAPQTSKFSQSEREKLASKETNLEDILNEFDEEDEDETFVDLLDDDELEDLTEDEEEDERYEDEEEDEDEEENDDEEIQDQIIREYGSNLTSAAKDIETLSQISSQAFSTTSTTPIDATKLMDLNDPAWGADPKWQEMEILSMSDHHVVQKINIVDKKLLALFRQDHLIPENQSVIVLTSKIKETEEKLIQLNQQNQLLLHFYNANIRANNYQTYYNLEYLARDKQKILIFSAFQPRGSADECLLKICFNHSYQDNPSAFLLLTMFANIFYGLQQIHSAGLLHLNIAAHSILVDEKYQGKLSGFYHARAYNSLREDNHGMKSNILWLDQERMRGNITHSSDLFALKMTMLEMISYAIGMHMTNLLNGMTLVEFQELTQRSGNHAAIMFVKMNLQAYLLDHTQEKICQELINLLRVFDNFFSWQADIENVQQMELAKNEFKQAYNGALIALKEMHRKD